MPRPPVDPDAVFTAADALLAEGINPTVTAVRDRLGGGSYSSLSPIMAEWRARTEASNVQSIPEIPNDVMAEFTRAWGSAWNAGQRDLVRERDEFETTRKGIESENAELLAEIQRLEASNNQLGKALATKEDEYKTAQAKIVSLERDLASAQSAKSELQSTNSDYKKRLDKADQRLEDAHKKEIELSEEIVDLRSQLEPPVSPLRQRRSVK